MIQQTVNKESNQSSTLKKEVDTIKDSIIFQSSPNGIADIRLTIMPNGNFNFHMRTIPQPMTEEEEAIINSAGNWAKKDNRVSLNFLENQPILTAVFDTTFTEQNEFVVIDENTVDINIGRRCLSIWGVDCEKIKG